MTDFTGYMYPSMTCFKEGTKILTNNGYRPIETLRVGDRISTLWNGFQPIVMIGKRTIYHPASPERVKEQLYVCSPEQYPEVIADLVLTGCHSILVRSFSSDEQRARSIEVNGDLFVTDNRYRVPACVDERATVYPHSGNYDVYHLALEHTDPRMNYGIYANGLLVESCSIRHMNTLANMELLQ